MAGFSAMAFRLIFLLPFSPKMLATASWPRACGCLLLAAAGGALNLSNELLGRFFPADSSVRAKDGDGAACSMVAGEAWWRLGGWFDFELEIELVLYDIYIYMNYFSKSDRVMIADDSCLFLCRSTQLQSLGALSHLGKRKKWPKLVGFRPSYKWTNPTYPTSTLSHLLGWTRKYSVEVRLLIVFLFNPTRSCNL